MTLWPCRSRYLCAVLLAFCAGGEAAPAGDQPSLVGGAGYYDIIAKKDTAAELHLEYRGHRLSWILKPVVGIMATTDTGVYGYAGLAADLFLGQHWALTPSLAVGTYHDSGGKDLGHTVEFRSALEFSYRFDNHSRLGLVLYHLSNASLSKHNPGAEVLGVFYGVPLN